jgi:hypothetical protein
MIWADSCVARGLVCWDSGGSRACLDVAPGVLAF